MPAFLIRLLTSRLAGPIAAAIAAVLALALVVQTFRIEGLSIWPIHIKGLKAELADTRRDLADTKTAFAQTVSNYRAAAAKATADDAANKVRVERQQTQISKEQSDEFEARIAAAHALAERLRREAARPAHSGGSAAATVPGVPAAPNGPSQAACDRLPDGSFADDKLCATEQAIQLDELIKWVERQHAVDVNGSDK